MKLPNSKFQIIFIIFLFSYFLLTPYVNAQTTNSCDLCGWCKNDSASKPSDWENCMRCIFPKRANDIGIGAPGSRYTQSTKPPSDQSNPYYPSTPEVRNGIQKNWTVFGCLDAAPGGFVTQIYKVIVSVGSGLALLAFIYGGFQVLTAGGDPLKIASGKHIITGAMFGIILIIFAIFILRLIGFEIIKIPGFG